MDARRQVVSLIMNNRIQLLPVLIICISLLLGGCGDDVKTFDLTGQTESDTMRTTDLPDDKSDQKSESERADEDGENASAFVYVCGQVLKPGVYELTGENRVCDAIEAAGGPTKDADAQLINQAAQITDGMRIYVPSKEETESVDRFAGNPAEPSAGSDIGVSGSEGTGKVNINTASKEELMTLAGIGESKASSIIEYREQHGRFSSIEDIMNIRGIKEGVFEKIKDQITV